MNRADVLRLALEAGLFDDDQEPLPECLEKFFEQAFILGMQEQARKSVDRAVNAMADAEVLRLIAKEREECAKVCDDQAEYADEHLTDSAWRSADRCAAAIRARKSK